MTRRTLSLVLTATIAAISFSPATAAAEDILAFGDRIWIKPGQFLRAWLSGAIVPPGADADPTMHGGELRIFDTAAAGAGEAAFDLPADGWKGFGKPAGSKGYVFDAGSCTVRLTTGRLRATCRAGVTLRPPVRGEVGVILRLGENTTRYCAEFGGSHGQNTERVVSRFGSGIPTGCSAIEPTPTPTVTPTPLRPTNTPDPDPCAGKSDGQTCDSGMDGAVLTCERRACRTCVPRLYPRPRFVDNGDSTVTDRRTCFVWEQKTGTFGVSVGCPGGSTCNNPHDVNNNYALTDGPAGTAFDGPAKTAFLDVLNDVAGGGASCFARHCDWRLPTSGGNPSYPTGEPAELETLLISPYPCGTSPCIDAIFNTPPYASSPGFHWSATTCPPDQRSACFVDFASGGVFGNLKDQRFSVRAVRGGS